MSTQENKKGVISRFISVILVFSMLICALPIYINSVSEDEEYDLPWLWPVPGSYVITGLDYYYSGNAHGKGQAVDIGNNGYTGSTRLDVISATSGEVLYIQKSYDEADNRGSGWGNYVIVRSGNVCIIYAHLQKVTCKYGKINAGDVIGKMGNTGNSTGVHLHIQAYPYDQNSTSTDIHIFDKYIDNPLYVPHFAFRNGVIKYSKRYGDQLSEYYTSLSGSEHVFTGGYFGDYGEKELGATIKSVRTDGARIYSQPTTSSTHSETVAFGKEITVYAYYYDAYGKLWYLVSDSSLDKWIPESDVGFSSYTFGAEYEDKSSPSGTYGSYQDIYFSGTVSVSNVIKTVKAEIRNKDGVVASYETSVNSNKFEINNAFAEGFAIEGLSDGEYVYEIFVTERAVFPGADAETKTYSVYSSEFCIDNLASDNVPPLVEEIKLISVTDTAISLSVKATDNVNIQRLSFVFKNQSGFEASFDALSDGDAFTAEIPISALSGSGSYTLTAKAYDPYMNTDESSIVITLPPQGGSETWKVQVSSSLTVRKGPATSYAKVTSLSNNALITVKEVVYNKDDGRNWANIGTGWVALNYATYQSGYLYNVTLNLLGGSGIDTSIDKRFNQDLKLPDAKPTRKGYTFLGWSTDPSATSPEYQAGDTYSENKSIVLYAIWEDKTPPTLADVTLSEKTFVSESVTLTVNASDNTETVYYSFDGGISYRRSNTFTVYENQTIPAKTIMVKDASGNVTVYDKEIVISVIDKTAPTIDEATLDTNVSGDKVTFVFGDAKDNESGIDSITLVYSVNSDLSGGVSETVSSGHTVTFGDGVYYAKLVITDKVGNKTEASFDRFLVGEPTKLSTPENLIIKKSSDDKVILEWKSVNNADHYILTVAESADFSGAVTKIVEGNSMALDSLESGKVYYVKLQAATFDGLYLTSDATESISFETVSSDNSIYSFKTINAKINGLHAQSKLHYAASSVDISCVVHDRATVKYYSDESCLTEITSPQSYLFATDESNVYIVVTAENGTKATYVLTLYRSSKDAEIPSVIFEASGESIYAGALGKEIGLTASINDGGTVSVVWYYSYSSDEPVPFANGFSCTPRFTKAGSYKVYAVVTNTNELCQNSVSTVKTSEAEYTVLRNKAQIEAVISDFTYNGMPANPSYSLYEGDGSVTFKYYADANHTSEIAAPVNAGTYFVKAFAPATDAYESAESVAKQFTIKRMSNTSALNYTVIQPTLRQRFGTITVSSSGVEFSVNDGDYVAMEIGRSYTFDEGDKVEIRYAQTQNVSASEPIEIKIVPFSGTDGFYPSDSLDARVDGDYFIVNADALTADGLISLLTKKENIEIRDNNGVLMNGKGDLLYSGCQISIVDSDGVYKSLTVIILADADRDGKVTYDDVMTIMKLSNGMLESNDPLYVVICDLDGDGVITSLDASLAYSKTK